jgi:membrane peptidoglycan carboxypeptidase
MGQEIAVTMPQLAPFSVIANGGYLVEPYFVERAIAKDGTETYKHQQIRERVILEETAKTMRELLNLRCRPARAMTPLSRSTRAARPAAQMASATGRATTRIDTPPCLPVSRR